MTFYNFFLSFHLIGIVCWFAGIFYLVRLCIYHREALDKVNPEQTILTTQFTLMENRLRNIIVTPSLGLIIFTGGFLLYLSRAWSMPWFHLKVFFLVLLFVYHYHSGLVMKKLQRGDKKWSSAHLRLYNEIATLLLIAIIFCAKLKDIQTTIIALMSVLILALSLFIIIKLIRKGRSG